MYGVTCWAGHVTECHSVYCVAGVEGGRLGESSEGACMQGGCRGSLLRDGLRFAKGCDEGCVGGWLVEVVGFRLKRGGGGGVGVAAG